LAGTGYVDITAAGSSNVVLYPAHIKDRSGNGNDMIFGAATNDQQAFATAPYMGNASSGSNDNALGRLALATVQDRFTWGSHVLFAHMRVLMGTLVAGRSVWGAGKASTAEGPRLNVNGSTTSKLDVVLYHSGGTLIIGTTAADVFSTSVEHALAVALNSINGRCTVWIDGVRDLAVDEINIAAATSVTLTSDLRIGGAYSDNAHAAFWSDYHLLSFPSMPGNIDSIAAKLATTRYYRLRAEDVR